MCIRDRAHTAYVAGVKDTDTHIEFFWNSMENFSQVWTVLVVLVTRHIRLKTKIKLVKTGTVDFLKTVTIF